jgi:hypothetical protein
MEAACTSMKDQMCHAHEFVLIFSDLFMNVINFSKVFKFYLKI